MNVHVFISVFVLEYTYIYIYIHQHVCIHIRVPKLKRFTSFDSQIKNSKLNLRCL